MDSILGMGVGGAGAQVGSPLDSQRISTIAARSLSLLPEGAGVGLGAGAASGRVGDFDLPDQIVRGENGAIESSIYDLCQGQAVAHVLGDRVASESGYEGWRFEQGGELLCKLLDLCQKTFFPAESPEGKSLIDVVGVLKISLGNYGSVETLASYFHREIQSLLPGGKLLIPSGWADQSGGHAILVEVVCTKIGFFDLSIYNTGGGLDKSSSIIRNFLDRRVTSISFQNVKKKYLLEGSPHSAWLQTLFEIKCKLPSEKNYNMDVILQLCFAPLLEEREVSKSGAIYFREQHSGTCSYRSIVAWLHAQLSPELYKAVVTWVQTQVLLRAYERKCLVRSQLGLSFNFLRVCARELEIHSIGRLRKHKGELGERLGWYLNAAKIGDRIGREIEERGRAQTMLTRADSRLALLPRGQCQSNLERFWRGVDTLRIQMRATEAPPCSPMFRCDRVSRSGREFCESLREIFSARTRFELKSYLSGIADYVLAQPKVSEIKRTWLTELVENPEVLQSIMQIQILFHPNEKSLINPAHQTTVLKLLAISHMTACELSRRMGDGGLLSEQRLPNLMDAWLSDRYEIIAEQKIIEEIEDLRIYFRPFQKTCLEETLIQIEGHPKSAKLDKDHPSNLVRWAFELVEKCELSHFRGLGTRADKVRMFFQRARNGVISNFSSPDSVGMQFVYSLFLETLSLLGTDNQILPLRIDLREDVIDRNVSMITWLQGSYVFFNPKKEEQLAVRSLTLHSSEKLKEITTGYPQKDFFKRFKIPSEEVAITLFLDNPLGSVSYSQSVLDEQPGAILHYFQEHLIKLQNPGIISLWVLGMLKSGLSGGVMSIPLRKAIQEESFRLQLESFIEKSFKLFVDQTVDGKVNHGVCLQLAIVVLIARSQLLEATGRDLLQAPAFPLLKAYLESPVLPEMSPRDAQIRYQIQVFNACLANDCQSALEGWILQKALTGRVPESQRLGWFSQIVEKIYFEKVERFVSELSDINRFAQNIFLQVGMREIDFQERWTRPSTTSLSVDRQGVRLFEMDFLNGTIATDEGFLTVSSPPEWIYSQSFKELFPSGITRYSIEGRYLVFQASERTFRAKTVQSSEGWFSDFAIYERGVWLKFIHPKELKEVLPKSLAQRYLYFRRTDDALAYGLDRDNFEIQVTVSKREIKRYGERQIIEKLWGESSLFQGLVSSDRIEVCLYDTGKIRLKFPTLHIWEGGEISLLKDQDRYELESHPGYFLITDISKPKIFGAIKEWMFFKNEKGDAIYYVPVGQFKEIGEGEFNLLDQNESWYQSIDRKRHVVEYIQSSSGPLMATTPEGNFYLSMLWLMQNQYDLFLEQIYKYPSEDLSEKNLEKFILDLFNWFKSHHNNSPKHLACLCHFIRYSQKILPRENRSVCDWVHKIYAEYYRLFDRIPFGMRLSSIEEWEMGGYWSSLSESRSRVLMGEVVQSAQLTKSVEHQRAASRVNIRKRIVELPSFLLQESIPLNEFSQIFAKRLQISSSYTIDLEKEKMIIAAIRITRQSELDQLERFIKANLSLTSLRITEEFLFILFAIHQKSCLDAQIYRDFTQLFPLPRALSEVKKGEVAYVYKNFIKHAKSRISLEKLELKEGVRVQQSWQGPLRARHHPIQEYQGRDLRSSFQWSVVPPLIHSITGGLVAREISIRAEFDHLNCSSMRSGRTELAILEESRVVREDLLLGVEKLRARREVEFEGEIQEARGRFQREIEVEESLANTLEKDICDKLNFVPPADIAFGLERGGVLRNQSTMKEAVYLFLRGSKALFLKENSYLDEAKIDVLMRQIEEWLVLQTELQHKKRIEKLFKKDDAIEEESIEKRHLRFEIYKGLLAERQYTNSDPSYFLVFEYAMDMRLRKEQIDLIRDMLTKKTGTSNYQDMIAQLAMGGGKTSVLAVILLAMAPDTGGFGMMCTPKSQFQSVKKDLRTALHKVFNKQLYTLEIGIQDLDTLEKVKDLHRKIKFAWRCGDVLLTTPESMQIIKLEFQRFEGEVNRLRVLAEILKLLETKCHVLIDEEHSVLDPFKEVNVPEGTKKRMNPDDIQAIQFVFESMTERGLDAAIGLCLNKQAEMDSDFFKLEIVPRLATLVTEKLLKNPILEDVEGELVAYFSREEEKPETLIQKIRLLKESTSINDQKIARQIALVKHVLFDVLPTTLTKSCGRNYGRIPSGKVVPYQGVDTPSFSEFGYHIEAACYQMATALQVGINEDQIKWLGLKMIEHSVRTAMKHGICVRETPESVKFKKMTGIYLDEVHDPKKLRSAKKKLRGERERGEYKNIFAFEAETIMVHISYHAYRMTSGPHSFLSMFASRRAFSGTPVPETCPESMQSRFLSEAGSEGQVLALLLDRNFDGSHLHSIDSSDPVSMLEKIIRLYPEKPERVSMLLDPAGLFKDSNTLEIAVKVRNHLNLQHAKFKGVLFFARPLKPLLADFSNPEYLEESIKREQDYRLGPDRLAFLPLHSDDLIYLPGTDEASLALVGLKPGEYFVICDERHTIGTNIKMTPDAVGVMTMNEMLTHATVSQAVMRLRQYSSSQDVHVMLPEKTIARFGTSIVEMMIRAAAIEKSMLMLRSFYQKVDNVTNEMAVKLLVDQTLAGESLKKLKTIKESLTPCLVYAIQDDPVTFIEAEFKVLQTATLIQTRFKKRKGQFKEILERLGIPFALYTDVFKSAWESIERQMQASQFLPLNEQIKVGGGDFGQEVEQVTEVAEVVRELQIENQQEILEEIRRLQELYGRGRIKRDQVLWRAEDAAQFLIQVQNQNTWSRGRLCVNTFESFFIAGFPELSQFTGALDDHLLCSENFARVYADKQLPLFHQATRPLLNMLLIETDAGYKIVVISLEETKFWRNYLHTNMISGVWLLDKHGESIADIIVEGNLEAFPIPNEEEVYRLLVQVNVIAGRVSFLNSYKVELNDWVSEKPIERQRLIKFGVLSLGDAAERDLFFENEALSPETAREIRESRVRFLVHRREQLGRAGEDLSLLTPDEIQNLDLESDIERLHVEQVQFLKKNQIYALKKAELIHALTPEMVPYVREESVCLLRQEQVAHLGVSNKVKFLQGVDQINAARRYQIMLLTPAQRALLNPARQEAYNQVIRNYRAFLGLQLAGIEDEEVLDAIEDSQVQELTPESISQITSERLILKLRDDQIQKLTSAQIIKIESSEIIDRLALKQVSRLTKREIKKIESSYLFNRLSKRQLVHLTDGQILRMNLEQVRKFIKVAPERSFKLEKEKIQKLTLWEIWDLPKATIQMATVSKKIVLIANSIFQTIALQFLILISYPYFALLSPCSRKIRSHKLSLKNRMRHASRLLR